MSAKESAERDVAIPPLDLQGHLSRPEGAQGLVLFAHGSGSSRASPRNVAVASALNRSGFATLLFDLLTENEERYRTNVFDIALLAGRLENALDWTREEPSCRSLPLGLFGASTGSAAALVAAAHRPDEVRAVVSRGGRPDLAEPDLDRVKAPTLLIVGGADRDVLLLNKTALSRMTCERKLVTIPGASHLFPEPGALEAVTAQAKGWFAQHLSTTDAA